MIVERVHLQENLQNRLTFFDQNSLFLCVEKNSKLIVYKIGFLTQTQPLCDLDKATELTNTNQIDHHAAQLASDKKWMASLAIGIPLGMAVIGLGSLYVFLRIVENFRYNK